MKATLLTALLGLDLQELSAIAETFGQAPFRVRQIMDALYRQRVDSIAQISTLPQKFREELEQNFSLGLPEIEQTFVSLDGTIRYLMRFADAQTVETVWMPEGDDGEAGDGTEESARRGWNRATICVSSQVGCAVDCQFCLTAQLGIKRNLSAGEIVGQVCAVLKHRQVSPPNDRVNLVFMGMGEPFLNYDNFIKSVRLLVEGVGIPESRMTVSTAGIVPRIYDLGKESVRPKLAISVNASNDETRTRLMPVNRKWNLETLLRAARDFPLRNREKLTFEYVLLEGVNDSPAKCARVGELGHGYSGEGESDRLEFRPGHCVRYACARACSGFSAGSDRARGSRLYPPSAGARYLCCLRAAEAHGRVDFDFVIPIG